MLDSGELEAIDMMTSVDVVTRILNNQSTKKIDVD